MFLVCCMDLINVYIWNRYPSSSLTWNMFGNLNVKSDVRLWVGMTLFLSNRIAELFTFYIRPLLRSLRCFVELLLNFCRTNAEATSPFCAKNRHHTEQYETHTIKKLPSSPRSSCKISSSHKLIQFHMHNFCKLIFSFKNWIIYCMYVNKKF